MRLISRSAAISLLANAPALTKIRLDMGKYDWNKRGSFKDRDIDVGPHVHAIWMERRQDSDGPYAIFMCLADYTK